MQFLIHLVQVGPEILFLASSQEKLVFRVQGLHFEQRVSEPSTYLSPWLDWPALAALALLVTTCCSCRWHLSDSDPNLACDQLRNLIFLGFLEAFDDDLVPETDSQCPSVQPIWGNMSFSGLGLSECDPTTMRLRTSIDFNNSFVHNPRLLSDCLEVDHGQVFWVHAIQEDGEGVGTESFPLLWSLEKKIMSLSTVQIGSCTFFY